MGSYHISVDEDVKDLVPFSLKVLTPSYADADTTIRSRQKVNLEPDVCVGILSAEVRERFGVVGQVTVWSADF